MQAYLNIKQEELECPEIYSVHQQKLIPIKGRQSIKGHGAIKMQIFTKPIKERAFLEAQEL